MQKLYCYVDETGQDARSKIFIVVAVVTAKKQHQLREKLLTIEKETSIGIRKWTKASHDRRIVFLKNVIDQKIGKGDLFYSSYKKTIPYFLPMLDLTAKAIKIKAKGAYTTKVYVDGIDRKKAKELTNALRVENISLSMVKMRRDESEPLIRLADRWAGCVRASVENKKQEKSLVKKAVVTGYLQKITN